MRIFSSVRTSSALACSPSAKIVSLHALTMVLLAPWYFHLPPLLTSSIGSPFLGYRFVCPVCPRRLFPLYIHRFVGASVNRSCRLTRYNESPPSFCLRPYLTPSRTLVLTRVATSLLPCSSLGALDRVSPLFSSACFVSACLARDASPSALQGRMSGEHLRVLGNQLRLHVSLVIERQSHLRLLSCTCSLSIFALTVSHLPRQRCSRPLLYPLLHMRWSTSFLCSPIQTSGSACGSPLSYVRRPTF